ncbi:MAG TPA: LOG family protein [Candidatus Eisenbacteria bacterium]|nr:LOG family protein [Candidatus Eisenbacteria bacterium]
MTILSHRQPLVAVFGSSTLREGEPAYEEARKLGRALAEQGAAVMTGGYGGAMAACSRGAHDAGGHVVGVTVELFESRGPANPWVRERVHTPDLYARLRHLVHEADGFVAVTGSIGTLTEVFLTWTMVSVDGRPHAPIVLMGRHWHAWLEAHRAPGMVPEHLFRFVDVADTPDQAARLVVLGIARSRAGRLAPAGGGGA